MKKLRNLIAVLAMMSMAAVLTGCGDDDDSGDDDDQPAGPTVFAPLDEAALTAQNKTYTINIAGQAEPITLTFPANGQYQIAQGGVTENGAITGASRDVNRWTMTLTPAEGSPEGAQQGVLQLDFTANNAGTATFTPTDGVAETGTFTLVEGGGNGDGGDGGDNGGNPGELPASLTGRTLQLNFSGGGAEKFTFTSDNAVSYEDGAETGNYVYDQANRRVTVTLGTGWIYDITLNADTTGSVFFKQDAADPGTTDAVQEWTLN